jgi:hypothetical protein
MERRAPDVAGDVSKRTAETVVTIGSQIAPVSNNSEPGHVHLKDTGFVEQKSKTRYMAGFSAPYAKFVNDGTVFMDADPFFNTAVEFARKDVYEPGQREFFKRVSV